MSDDLPEPHGANQHEPHPLERLHELGLALSAERNPAKLLELILTEAQRLCNADGGSLYLRTSDDQLKFEIVHNHSLGIGLGGTSDSPVPRSFPSLPLFNAQGAPNTSNVATYAAHAKRPVHVPDAYHADGFDFAGTKQFDEQSGYRSKSFFTIPLINGEEHVIGVLQLLNAQDRHSGEVIPFDQSHREMVTALAAQAALALDNRLLLEAQKNLLEAFIKMIASAIDSKSPYTGGHCERVPVLTEMIVRELCSAESGPFADFSLTEDEWYELRIAAWLHDCGKVTTPVHVMDKATKLETITDRIETVRLRFALLERDAKIEYLERQARGESEARAEYERTCAELADDLALLEKSNVGGEFLPPETKARIRSIGQRTYFDGNEERPLLDADELENLCVAKGTLTDEERLMINGHMVQTIRMLEALPFPRHLCKVPEYAAGHHEKMDGSGYPRGLYAGDMSIPARAMAIADVFEALTASDRPYKAAKKLSETMRIMGFMKRDNHLDPVLFDEFVRRRVYLQYARKFLAPELIDEVDEAALLAIEPRAFELPPEGERSRRWDTMLEEYQERFPERVTILPGS